MPDFVIRVKKFIPLQIKPFTADWKRAAKCLECLCQKWIKNF